MTAGPRRRRETLAIAAGRPERRSGAPFNEPIILASALHADGSTGYARHGPASWAALENATACPPSSVPTAEESDEVPAALVRVTIGCEHVEDLWDDLEQALQRTGAGSGLA